MSVILRRLVVALVILTAGFGEWQVWSTPEVATAAGGPEVVAPTQPLAPSPSRPTANPTAALADDYRLAAHMSPTEPVDPTQRLQEAAPTCSAPADELLASARGAGASQRLPPIATRSASRRGEALSRGEEYAVTRIVLDGDTRTAASVAIAEECSTETRRLSRTEAAGPDDCGTAVGEGSAWPADLGAGQHTVAEGGTEAMAGHPWPDGDRTTSLSADDATLEMSADGMKLPALAERHLLIDQAAQVMRVYQNGTEARVLPVSTGMLTSKTFTRAWQGTVGRDMGAVPVEGGMHVEQAWYLFPDVFGNILIHSVPYVQQGTLRVYDQPDALGVRPSSHGCIRISEEDARWLREWDPVGVSIEITGPPGPVRRVD